MYDCHDDTPLGDFSSPSFARFRLNAAEDGLMKDYLYKLSLKKFSSENFKVTKVLGFPTGSFPVASKAKINYSQSNDFYLLDDEIIVFSALFFGQHYELTFQKAVERDYSNSAEVLHFANLTGISAGANRSRELIDKLFSESQRFSIFNGKTITFNLLGEDIESSNYLAHFNIITPKPIQLSDLYISDLKKEQVERFIYSVENFEKEGTSLRYLLSGPPGTGKTQLINSVINQLHNTVTTIVVQGGSFPFRKIFEYCAMFDKCLLVVDDIDFIVNDRETSANRKELAVFLQYLDGFIPNNIFLIASTNDKSLVDAAASRPGRFDLIMDISEIDSCHYLSLVKRETSDSAIISLFNNEALGNLKRKNVTGAFIVSLVKQLSILKNMKGMITADDFVNYTELTHKGFYSSNSESYSQAVGF